MQRLTILTKRYCHVKREAAIIPSRFSVGSRIGSYDYHQSKLRTPKNLFNIYKNIGKHRDDINGLSLSTLSDIGIAESENNGDVGISMKFGDGCGWEYHDQNIFITIDSRLYYGQYDRTTGRLKPAEYNESFITSDIRVYSVGNRRYEAMVAIDIAIRHLLAMCTIVISYFSLMLVLVGLYVILMLIFVGR